MSREETEKGDKIIDAAAQNHVVFLTGGDPMIATTHVDLRLRAIKQGITTKIIHSSSISTAVPGNPWSAELQIREDDNACI